MGDVIRLPPMCWLYVICWRQRGPSKIGISLRPTERLYSLQTACPYKLHVWKAFGLRHKGEAYEAERLVLSSLQPSALHGEWTAVTVHQAEKEILSILQGRNIKFVPWSKTRQKEHEQPSGRYHYDNPRVKVGSRRGVLPKFDAKDVARLCAKSEPDW